ncbi:unnamed protein product [Vicia faba]|uniref:Uncharacterized protein n=1 Tax=Vicia faba TaxID=3906 RepID=A0AAV1ALE8_VICFA|nr:unnamed protein product [Vicia faba]
MNQPTKQRIASVFIVMLKGESLRSLVIEILSMREKDSSAFSAHKAELNSDDLEEALEWLSYFCFEVLLKLVLRSSVKGCGQQAVYSSFVCSFIAEFGLLDQGYFCSRFLAGYVEVATYMILVWHMVQDFWHK